MLDVNSIRQDFPLLDKKVGGKRVIYFDNACMSLRPQQVINEINRYYLELSACAGRSNHRLAKAVNEAVEESRESIRRFINAKRREEIIFVRNTSEGLNLVAQSMQPNVGDVIITTDKEHNSNLVPWLRLKEQAGIEHKIVRSKSDNTFDMEAFEMMLNEQVKLVSVVHTSNMDGVTFPVKEMVEKAHNVGAKVMIDAAQSTPHQKLDVQDLDADFVAFSGHKMLGPSGTGVLYGKYELLDEMEPFMAGGDTVVGTTYDSYEMLPLPEKYEAGLQNYAGIMGFKAAVDYLMNVGLDNIHEHEVSLNKLMTDELKSEERIKIIGPEDTAKRGGVFSFYIDGVDVHQIALMLDEMSTIMIRSGQHCVHSWFDDKGIHGSARASLYLYNTKEEVEIFSESLKKVLSVL